MIFKRSTQIAITSLFCISCSAGVPDAGVMTVASIAQDGSHTEETATSTGTNSSADPTPASTTSRLKTGNELSMYIRCYLEPSAHGRYNAVQSIMRGTAAAFNMPESLVECSFFQESRFNATATNTVTIFDKKTRKYRKINRPQICRGIAQINDNTVKEIEKIISKKLTVDQRTEFEARLKNPEKYKDEQLATAEVALVQDDLAKLWKNYFLAKNKIPPKSFNQAMVLNPEYAIPAGALYHLYNLRRIASSLIDSRSGGDESVETLLKNIDFLPTGAAAYNMGLGRTQGILNRHIKKLPEGTKVTVKTLNDALKGRSVPLETKNYTISVRTCMEAGNFQSFVQGKLAKDKDCEKKR